MSECCCVLYNKWLSIHNTKIFLQLIFYNITSGSFAICFWTELNCKHFSKFWIQKKRLIIFTKVKMNTVFETGCEKLHSLNDVLIESDDLFDCLHPFLIFGRIIGLVPISNLMTKNLSSISYRYEQIIKINSFFCVIKSFTFKFQNVVELMFRKFRMAHIQTLILSILLLLCYWQLEASSDHHHHRMKNEKSKLKSIHFHCSISSISSFRFICV